MDVADRTEIMMAIGNHDESTAFPVNAVAAALILADKTDGHGKVGYVVEPDAKEIADALVDFVDHRSEADFRDGILEEKAKYAWSNMTAMLFDVATQSQS